MLSFGSRIQAGTEARTSGTIKKQMVHHRALNTSGWIHCDVHFLSCTDSFSSNQTPPPLSLSICPSTNCPQALEALRPTDRPSLPTNPSSEILAMKQKTLRCGSFGFRNIHQTSYTLSVFFHTRPGGIFMRPDKVADIAGRKAGCWTH